jgi:hypothetical protein
MSQRVKVGNFYLDVQAGSSPPDNHPDAGKTLMASKPETPEALEPQPYIFRPNDPFQSGIDRIEAAGRLSSTHKPWVKTAWLYIFVIIPLIFMELFAIAEKSQANSSWKAFAIIHFFMLVYGMLSYSMWLNKTKST